MVIGTATAHSMTLFGSASREIGDRVRSAVCAAGFEWPRARVVVDVKPRDGLPLGCRGVHPTTTAVLQALSLLAGDTPQPEDTSQLAADRRDSRS